MAKRIYLKEDGLSGSGPVPAGYKQIGYEGATFSEKSGFTSSTIGGGSEWIETIVNISSSQILNMGTTPIELLPAPGVNKYYDIEQIAFEYTYGTTPYSGIQYITYAGRLINSDLIQAEENRVLTILPNVSYSAARSFNNGETTNLINIIESFNRINDPIVISSSIFVNLSGFEEANPTDGDGTMRAIIKYKVRTFGE